MQTVHRSGDIIVIKMRKASHAETSIEQHIKIAALALKVLQALDGQQRPNLGCALDVAPGEQALHIGRRFDDQQIVVCLGGTIELHSMPE